jgi:hypothetical protein
MRQHHAATMLSPWAIRAIGQLHHVAESGTMTLETGEGEQWAVEAVDVGHFQKQTSLTIQFTMKIPRRMANNGLAIRSLHLSTICFSPLPRP